MLDALYAGICGGQVTGPSWTPSYLARGTLSSAPTHPAQPMSSDCSDPSPHNPSPLPRPRPPHRPSSASSTPPSRAMPSQHHRRSSGSALTVQTQMPNHSLPTGSQGLQDYPNNPRFSYLLNSVLGSPFLTTTDIAQAPSSYGLDNNGGENYTSPRPSSPTPTADYSIIDADELEGDVLPVFRIPGGYPRSHQRSMSFGFNSHATWPHRRFHTYDTGSGLSASSFLSLNHPTESISMPNMPQPSNPFKTLLPRILDALSSPSRAFSGNFNSSSPPSSSPVSANSSPPGSSGIFPHSFSLPTGLLNTPSPSGRQSPLLWGTQSRNINSKGKGRAQPSQRFSFTSELVDDLDYSELSPLDGEEGELIDEACFVDIRAVTGLDILALLPTEVALYILLLVCPPPISSRGRSIDSNPLSDTAEEQSKDALRALLACDAVSRTWRRLASDNSVWQALFLGRWGIDLRKADASHIRKLGSGLSPGLSSSPPPRQPKRQRWKLKTKSQLRFGPSTRSNTLSSSCTNPRTTSRRVAASKMSDPKQKFPLQFDWKRMYIERLQLERRWTGTAFVRVPVTPTEDSSMRESRSLINRRNARSRSLSPSRSLGFGDSASTSSISGQSFDRLFDTSTIGRAAGWISAKSQDSSGMQASTATLFKEQKWEPKTMELKGHSDSVYCVEFDSKRIITGSRDKTVMVWSLKTGKVLGTFAGPHTGSVLCLKFEKDWDLESPLSSPPTRRRPWNTGAQLANTGVDRNEGLGEGGEGLEYSGIKSGFMFTGSSDCTICVWHLETGDFLDNGLERVGVGRDDDRDRRVLAEPIAVLRGHAGGVLDIRIDKRWIVSCSKDTVVRVWDRKTLKPYRMLRGHEGPVNAVGLQDGRVVSASGDGKMILWDIETGERLKTFDGHDRGLACIDFKDGLIISGSSDRKIRVWNAWTGECLRTLAGHDALVRAISFDPKTGRLLSASYDMVVKVWDLHSGKLIREFKHSHTGHIFDVRFDLGRIVSASHDRKICVLDFTAGLNASVFI